ncbi:MAG TPA: hypothetical protein DD670_18970 [Planctomycetaceae bacterium]|nr:hypothetical protein [Planctomycetaceae bacterium]
MSAFEEYRFSPAQFSGVVRLFPIPNLVMFPNVMQPLRVFEPRYCELLRDAMDGDRFVTLAVLASGWQADYEGRPRLQPFACLGKVAACQECDDGTHNILLVGLRRVHLLKELPPTKAYREATALVCEDVYPPNQHERRAELKRELYGRLSEWLPGLPEVREQLGQLLHSTVSLGVLTDILSYALEIDSAEKEVLLSEANVHRRAELLLGHLAASPDEGHAVAGFPPDFSTN